MITHIDYKMYLAHEVGLEVGGIKAGFHLFQALKGDKGVEMAVDSNNVSACLGHPDRTLGSRDAVHVPLGPDAHGGGHWEGGLQALLNCPFHLLNVLVVLRKVHVKIRSSIIVAHLTEQEVHALRDKDIDLLLELFLDVSLGHAGQVGGAL